MFDSGDVEIARGWPEMIPGEPQIDLRRSILAIWVSSAGGPIRLYSANDERLSLDRLWLLMLDREPSTVRELGERELALRRIDLLVFLLQPGERALC